MSCIMRVSSQTLNEDKLRIASSIIPYRISVSQENSIKLIVAHYLVCDNDYEKFDEYIPNIINYIEYNRVEINKFSCNNDVHEITFDFSIFDYEHAVANFIKINTGFISLISKLRISLEISLYKSSGTNDNTN